MPETDLNKLFKAKLSRSDFIRLSKYIYSEYGIKMPETKLIMLQSRLQKRLRELKMYSYKEYIDFVFSKEGQREEIFHMIDSISTNKTDFFREPAHFDFLTKTILPEFISKRYTRGQIKFWSAGCSSGEEPYTLAIVLSEFALQHPSFNFWIYATDISTRMLKHAVTAIYPEERVKILPLTLKRRYLLKSKDSKQKTVRIVPQLRKKVTFNRLNFMSDTYNLTHNFDVIFCRNVLIYFDRATQEKVISKLCGKLKIGGYFFLGHSESIMNMNLPLKQVKPTVFIRI